MARETCAVYGHVIAACRVTRGGLYVALTHLALPFLLALDILIGVGLSFIGICYGVVCWI